MSKINIQDLVYKKPVLGADLSLFKGVLKDEIIIDPTPNPTEVPTPGDDSTGTGGSNNG